MYRNVPNAKIGNSHERPKRVNGRRAPLGRLTWSLLNVPKRLVRHQLSAIRKTDLASGFRLSVFLTPDP